MKCCVSVWKWFGNTQKSVEERMGEEEREEENGQILIICGLQLSLNFKKGLSFKKTIPTNSITLLVLKKKCSCVINIQDEHKFYGDHS